MHWTHLGPKDQKERYVQTLRNDVYPQTNPYR